jgi:hypothetical protein
MAGRSQTSARAGSICRLIRSSRATVGSFAPANEYQVITEALALRSIVQC